MRRGPRHQESRGSWHWHARIVSAALVVGTLFMLIILMGIGGEMGRRGQSKEASTSTAPPTPAEAS